MLVRCVSASDGFTWDGYRSFTAASAVVRAHGVEAPNVTFGGDVPNASPVDVSEFELSLEPRHTQWMRSPLHLLPFELLASLAAGRTVVTVHKRSLERGERAVALYTRDGVSLWDSVELRPCRGVTVRLDSLRPVTAWVETL